ncbi:TIGR00341 family protein [Engelhardtia mirabilis]|uniref:TIGR00341 family protein n=1 Tax=Engelhardtia mirabilis TaxID=2528011 RepID=A0A518BSP4_9BACT|nr:hypothetical protein Pla133_51110 [Planctomycetes bacterium Pla133]QDV04313.1 hypothetical protein Pla86_51080 [Planctomycetes bacterium Pla86]
MPLRLVAIRVPLARAGLVRSVVEAAGYDALWLDENESRAYCQVVVDRQDVAPLLDELSNHFPGESDLHAAVLEVSAVLPERAREDPEPEPNQAPPSRWPWRSTRSVSREELKTQLAQGAEVDDVFLITVLLSALVAAVGLVQGNVAVVVGAMVIAPLLGPNMSLALATTLGDGELFSRSIRCNAVGAGAGLGLAILIGALFPLTEPFGVEVASRTHLGFADLALALASGAAGALALTAGAKSSLVGVMVAVALMPPLVVTGMLLASGHPGAAGSAAMVVAANVICVILAAVATFLGRGIRPRAWWEAEASARRSRHALTVWIALLAVAAVFIAATELGWLET